MAARRLPVIAALGLLQIFAWGSSYYLMAVLAPAIVQDTGWSLPRVVGALTVALVSAGLVSPFVGRRIADLGGRRVLMAGCVLLAAGLALGSIAVNLAGFYLGWAVMGLGMGAALYDPAFATLGRLYGQNARSAITALTLWGGFASTICWPLSIWLLEGFDWRGVARIYALILLLVCLPLIGLLVPGQAKSPPAPAGEPPCKPRLAKRDRPAFYLMAAVLLVLGLTTTIVSVHLPTLLQSQGISLSEAVAIGAMIGPAQVAARLIEMAGRGRGHPIWSLLFATGAMALGLILLAADLRLPALAIILYGAGNGIFSIARGALPLTLFGPDRYAVVMGELARPSLLGQAAAPLIGGMLIANADAASTLTMLASLGITGFALALALYFVGRAVRA